MTLDKWKAQKGLTSWLAEILLSDNGQELLRMLEEVHIRHFHEPTMEAGRALGRIQGYDIAINNIVAASEYVKPQKEVQPTYEAPEEK